MSFEMEENAWDMFHSGKVMFVTAYAPRGMLGEVIAIFEKVITLDEGEKMGGMKYGFHQVNSHGQIFLRAMLGPKYLSLLPILLSLLAILNISRIRG